MENDTSNTTRFLELKTDMESLDTEVTEIQDQRQKLIWKNLAGALRKEDFDVMLAALDEKEAKIEYRREIYLEEMRELMHSNVE